MKKGKFCIVIGVACLMVICSAPAHLAQSSDLVADPPGLDFGVVYIGESATMSVAITNESGSTLLVEALDIVDN